MLFLASACAHLPAYNNTSHVTQVFDLLIQRFLELPALADLYLQQLLSRYGSLYKFHGTETTHFGFCRACE